MRKWPQTGPGELHVGHQKELFHWESCQSLEQTAQRSDGVISGRAQGMTVCGLFSKVVFGHRLHPILKAFPNLSDSMGRLENTLTKMCSISCVHSLLSVYIIHCNILEAKVWSGLARNISLGQREDPLVTIYNGIPWSRSSGTFGLGL